MIKNKNVFAIKATPCKSLADCLASYEKVQLQILVEEMHLDHLIKRTAKKTELVTFLSEQILSRLDYLFRYLNFPVFIVVAAFSKDDEIKIAIAGPLVNAFLIVFCVAIWWIFPSFYNLTNQFVMCNIYTLAFNIIPVYPLDGGRIFFALLSKKMARSKAHKIVKIVGYIITSIFFVLFFISFFFKLNYMLGINALFMLIGLVDDDKGAYYEKLTTLEKFQPFSKIDKIIKLDKSTPIYVAYKKLISEHASKISVISEKKEVKRTRGS